jgi:hypothetical protein
MIMLLKRVCVHDQTQTAATAASGHHVVTRQKGAEQQHAAKHRVQIDMPVRCWSLQRQPGGS